MQGGKSLFPDVLLFGDSNGAMAIQGWELKMPDTAKILFSEGAHKIKHKKPKFKRRFLEQGIGKMAMSYGTLDDALPSHQHNTTYEEINLGVDISTLIELIERELN